MPERDQSPEALAHTLGQRLFELLHECRTLLRRLEVPPASAESTSARAERLLYVAFLGALEAWLVRTMAVATKVLRRASQPLGPMDEEWLKLHEWLPHRHGTQS